MKKHMQHTMIPAGFFLCAVVLFPGQPLRAQQALTWEECIREASRNHPDLISAAEAVKESQAAKKVTASGEYPQVDASAGASTSKTSGRPSSKSYSASLSATQLLFDGKKTINKVKAAEEDIRTAKYSFRYSSAQVRQSLRTAFVELLKAQEMTRIAGEIFEIRRDNYELITLRYQSGLEHRGALLTAEANLAAAQFNIDTAVSDLRVKQRNLLKALGRDDWGQISVSGDFNVQDTAADPVDLDALASANPQVLRAATQKNAAEFNLKSLYGNYAPSVSLSAGAGKSGASLPLDTEEKNIGVTLSVPLFEGGLRNAQIGQAQAGLSQLVQSQRSAKAAVIAELERTRALLRQAVDYVVVQAKALEATQERAKIAEAQYSIGSINFDSWTIIQDNLVSAKRSYLNAQADALQAEANWVLAKGETLEKQ